MKRFILTMLISLMALSASAQQWGHSGYGNSFGNKMSYGDTQLSGYRGMVEGVMTLINNSTGFVFSTTHGYQFPKCLFVGVVGQYGRSYRLHYTRFDCDVYRLGLDVRTSFNSRSFSPVASMQVAHEWGDHSSQGGFDRCFSSFYCSATAGIRYLVYKGIGVIAACGVEYRPTWWKDDCPQFIMKVGVEF